MPRLHQDRNCETSLVGDARTSPNVQHLYYTCGVRLTPNFSIGVTANLASIAVAVGQAPLGGPQLAAHKIAGYRQTDQLLEYPSPYHACHCPLAEVLLVSLYRERLACLQVQFRS